MMVKNEEEFLAEALKSVEGLVDELVVVDTGSTDRTVEIAKEFGARVSYYPWRDDFSDARNETMRQSRGRWILILDADERVVINPAHIARMREGLIEFEKYSPYVGVSVDVINIRLDGSEMNSLPSLRLFPNTSKVFYQNRVHNQLMTEDPEAEMIIKLCDFLKINHLGYDPIIYEQRKKSDRSLPLIQKMIEDQPDNMVYRFYEGREFMIKNEINKAIESLEIAVLGIIEDKGGYFAETLKTLLSAYDRAHTDPERIIVFCDMGIERNPDQPDFWYFKAHALYNLNRMSEAVEAFKQAQHALENFKLIEVSQSHPIMSQTPWRGCELVGHILWDQDRFKEAYVYMLKAIKNKPVHGVGWPKLLNSACALAIEFNDTEHLEDLLKRLITHAEASSDMFFFRVQQLQAHGRTDEARALLKWGRSLSSKVKNAPDFIPICQSLQLDDLISSKHRSDT